MNSTALLSVHGLYKTFRPKNGEVKAVQNVSLSVRPGAITALVGPDGAGKTTLLRLLAGLLRADAGQIQRETDLHEAFGYMPQKFGLYEDLSVAENMELYADLRGLPRAERTTRFADLLIMADLTPFTDRLAGRLSGGMKQKLGLICALVRPPKLLLLDEPTVGVDPLSRQELWRMVADLATQGMGVVMSTAYLDEADRCDEVLLLHEGEVLERGTPAALRELARGCSWVAVPARGDSCRVLQARLLDDPTIMDAVPRAGAVRVVCRQTPPTKALWGASVHPVEPELEDSFMLLLKERVTLTAASGEATAGVMASQNTNPASITSISSAIITLSHVTKRFGNFVAVNNVSFSVNRGEVFGLLGPNGAGKTTTFRMLCGLLPASEGELFVAGVNVREAREQARRHIGYVAQKFSLYGPLSVRENLEFFAGAHGLRGATGQRCMAAVIRNFELESHLDTPAADLPGGCKQRLAMAVGLLHEPEILFLDEPTSGVDPLARRAFWKRITALAKAGVTVVVTTHFMEEAEYCDRVLIQDGGVMLALNTPARIRALAGEGDAHTMDDAFIAIVRAARQAQDVKQKQETEGGQT